jgi:hypothetical protein
VPDNPRGDFVFLRQVSLGPAAAEPVSWYLVDRTRDAQSDPDEPGDTPDGYETTTPEGALCTAPDEGADVAELMRLSGMTKPTLYRHLAAHAVVGRAIQVSRGRWRATTTRECLALNRPRDLESAVETRLHSNRQQDARVQAWVPEALLEGDG